MSLRHFRTVMAAIAPLNIARVLVRLNIYYAYRIWCLKKKPKANTSCYLKRLPGEKHRAERYHNAITRRSRLFDYDYACPSTTFRVISFALWALDPAMAHALHKSRSYIDTPSGSLKLPTVLSRTTMTTTSSKLPLFFAHAGITEVERLEMVRRRSAEKTGVVLMAHLAGEALSEFFLSRRGGESAGILYAWCGAGVWIMALLHVLTCQRATETPIPTVSLKVPPCKDETGTRCILHCGYTNLESEIPRMLTFAVREYVLANAGFGAFRHWARCGEPDHLVKSGELFIKWICRHYTEVPGGGSQVRRSLHAFSAKRCRKALSKCLPSLPKRRKFDRVSEYDARVEDNNEEGE
ncbi:hypothetical protein HBI47_171900 [Parastagonospora nodorum]|nr:hypothetical protein HBI47_171900 [Parastagonospora nodorum]